MELQIKNKNTFIKYLLIVLFFVTCHINVLAQCNCPDGFTSDASGLFCIGQGNLLHDTTVIENNTKYKIGPGNVIGNYGLSGTRIYTFSSDQLPLVLDDVCSANNDNVNVETFGNTDSEKVWGLNNRILNNAGVWSTETDSLGSRLPVGEWIGFTACVDVPSPRNYFVGLAADNKFRFRVNGNLIARADFDPFCVFRIWHIFQIPLNQGRNIIEMEGLNTGLEAAFAAEIYNATTRNELENVTTLAELAEITLFSTKSLRNDSEAFFDLGTKSGFSCPEGYALSLCDGDVRCVRVVEDTLVRQICDEACLIFNLEQEQTYYLNYWLKGQALNAFTGVSISCFNEQGNLLAEIDPPIANNLLNNQWQRLEKAFLVPEFTAYISLNFNNDTDTPTYFDDIRIIPTNASAVSYVYDPETRRLTAELDNNNYPTLYEYDNEGNLLRIKKETETGIHTIQESRLEAVKIVQP